MHPEPPRPMPFTSLSRLRFRRWVEDTPREPIPWPRGQRPVPTGLSGLDRPEGGLVPGELVLLGSPLDHETDLLVAWLLVRAAGKGKVPCLVFHDPMDIFDQLSLVLGQLGHREGRGQRTQPLPGPLDRPGQRVLERIFWSEIPATLADLRATARRFWCCPPPDLPPSSRPGGLVVVQHPFAAWPGHDQPPMDDAALAALGLKRLAEELGVTVLWMSHPILHLSRSEPASFDVRLLEHADRLLRLTQERTSYEAGDLADLEVLRRGPERADHLRLRLGRQRVECLDGTHDEDAPILYGQALKLATRLGRFTVGQVQHELRVGYDVATHLLERLVREGRARPPSPGEARPTWEYLPPTDP